ncbi:hypothetical protein RchiOBHm_Chr1g0375551 [Rosa chinensis]|uniref:Uncharacterized protein n=1 Tax=Rosa chinensis TaxID=74649 RepID=A0A2P6SMM0_ROSCH|nr:hypothetical protein RchiOBHm_Chr1g0375551 [Rosa chinensis]
MLDKSPTFGRLVIKSRETLSHGRVGIDSGSNSPGVFWRSILSCWHVKQVLVYSVTSSRIWGQ